MKIRGRRDFLRGGGLAVGILASEGCAVSSSAATGTTSAIGPQVAAFGWEVTNLYGNGANTCVKVANNMVLNTVEVDLSASIIKAQPPGFAEVLCVGGVSRQAMPSFSQPPQEYVNFPVSSSFGSVTVDNPNNLSVVFDGAMSQDQFLAVILKTWVPVDGSASAVSRHVLAYPALGLSAGDYLVFHMDHQGVSLDCEMQVVLGYTLAQ
jgi:hypothetical protein